MNLGGNNFKIWHYWGNLLFFLGFFSWFFVCFLFAFGCFLSSFIMFFCLVCYLFPFALFFISVLCFFVWFYVSQLIFLYIFLFTLFCCSWIFIIISDFGFFLEIYFEETYIFSCDSLPAADESFPNENLPSPRYDVTRITL